MLACELGFAPRGPTRLLGDSKAAFEGSLMDRMPQKERFLAASRAMIWHWIREKVITFVRVPSAVLRPEIFCKSDQEGFLRLAHWVQRGVPRDDDSGRLDALLRLESPAGGAPVACSISTVLSCDGAGDVGWEEPLPEVWDSRGVFVGLAVGSPPFSPEGAPLAAPATSARPPAAVVLLQRELKKPRKLGEQAMRVAAEASLAELIRLKREVKRVKKSAAESAVLAAKAHAVELAAQREWQVEELEALGKQRAAVLRELQRTIGLAGAKAGAGH
jgi:hypothetical protein